MSDRVMVTASPFICHEPEAGEPLRREGIEVRHAPAGACADRQAVIELLADCAGVIASMEPYDEQVFSALPQLRTIARWGVGYDSIDLQAATRARVIVTNTPGAVTESVADQTFALMLALARRIPEQLSVARSLQWCTVEGTELWRKTLGIVGLGSIGQAVARRAAGFSMRILAHDPYLLPFHVGRLNVTPVSLDRLLQESDIITLHANVTPESRGMIGEKQLRMMKPTALVVNCGRGALVEQVALARALQEGWIAGAALDALECEPPLPDDPILGAPNVIIAPHNSSMTAESAARVNALVCENVIAALAGRRPRFVVNRDLLD